MWRQIKIMHRLRIELPLRLSEHVHGVCVADATTNVNHVTQGILSNLQDGTDSSLYHVYENINSKLKFREDLLTEVFDFNFNLFTTIHDGNFRRHSSMNVTIK